MTRITMTFGDGEPVLTAKLRDTPTAAAIAAALPLEARTQTWGAEVYFQVPVTAPPEPDATDLINPGELAFWLAGSCIAIGFGPTPVSVGDEIRLASPANIWADAIEDVRILAAVPAGVAVRLEAAD